MEWALAAIALTLIAFGVVSRRVDGTPITPAIIFVGIGLLVGTQALDLARRVADRRVGEAARRGDAHGRAVLRRVPHRPTDAPTRVRGARAPARHRAAADDRARCAPRRGVSSASSRSPEALVLAVLLAPTDAALGQAVVTEPSLPSRIRQGLNVESGLNDGICVPLLFIVLAVAEADAGESARRTRSARGRGDRLRDRSAAWSPARSPPPRSCSAGQAPDRAVRGSRSSRSREPRSRSVSPTRSAAPASSRRSSPGMTFGLLRRTGGAAR